MTHLLHILALTSAWINKDSPESSSYLIPFFLYACISSLCAKFSPFSIHCNIVVKVILQTWPRWTQEREIMLTILPDRLLTLLQHPNTIEYCEHIRVLLADITHMEIHISPLSITNSVWTLSIQLSVTIAQKYWVVHILNAAAIVCDAVTVNLSIFTHKYHAWKSWMQGYPVMFRFSVLPAVQHTGLVNVTNHVNITRFFLVHLAQVHLVQIYVCWVNTTLNCWIHT